MSTVRNLQKNVTNQTLAANAAPDETGMVRVIVRRVANKAPYTLRGRKRSYRAEFNQQAGAHCIDVPLSLWQGGVDGGPYRDNDSVAHDIMANRGSTMAPLVYLVLPWAGAERVLPSVLPSGLIAVPPDAFSRGVDIFQDMLTRMNAPVEVIEALKLMREGHADALKLFVDSLTYAEPTDDPGSVEDFTDEGPPSDPLPDYDTPEPVLAPPVARRKPGRPKKKPVPALL